MAVSLTIPLSACGGSDGSSASSSGAKEVLRIGINEEPAPDPARAVLSGSFAAMVYALAYAPLIHVTPAGELAPALAESWRFVDAPGAKPNSVFELVLRQDARFSDGTPVTPDAVVKWLTHFVKSPNPYVGSFGRDPRFTAVDDRTVRIAMTAPNPSLPFVLSDQGFNAGFVMSPKAVDNPKLLAKGTYGAGPYRLAQSVRGDHYTYVPNPHYYDEDAIAFEKVDVKLIREASSRLQAQQSGQLDVAIGDLPTAGPAEGAGLAVKAAPYSGRYFVLDSKHDGAPALKDKRVRMAFNHAIDRASIARALFGKYGMPTSAFVPADVDPGLEDYWEYDPEKAKALLAEAGYEDGLTLKTITQGAYLGSQGEPLVRAAAKNLAEVGIKLDITAYATDAEYAKDVFAFTAPVFTPGQGVINTPSIWSIYLAPTAPVNFHGTDPVLEKLYNEGAVAEDPTAAWTQMYEHYTKQAYVAPLVVLPNLYFVSDGIQGVEVSKQHQNALPTEWSAE